MCLGLNTTWNYLQVLHVRSLIERHVKEIINYYCDEIITQQGQKKMMEKFFVGICYQTKYDSNKKLTGYSFSGKFLCV